MYLKQISSLQTIQTGLYNSCRSKIHENRH